MTVTKREARIVYLLAKAGEAVFKQKLSMATARWNREQRDQTLDALEKREVIAAQSTPARFGKPAGTMYWLTDEGVQLAESLHVSGILKLPDGWRDLHGSAGRPQTVSNS